MTITHISPREAELERGVAELKAKAEMDYAMLAETKSKLKELELDYQIYREGAVKKYEELRAKLAKYEKREPVAWLSWRAKDGYEYWETKREAELYCAGDTDPEPLYLGVKNE